MKELGNRMSSTMADMNRSARIDILETEIAAVRAQNDRLNEENIFLRDKLNRLTTNTRSTATSNVEAKIKAFQLEDERDQLFQNLENLKKRYNKLHEAYCEKVKRCKVLERTFQQQKTLPGLVMKSAIKQRIAEQEAFKSQENLEAKLDKLQTELDEAYDIIDALEFELETIDLLDVENQRLRDEVSSLKSKQKTYKSSPRPNTINFSDGPPSYSEVGLERLSAEHQHRNVDSVCEECISETANIDAETLERSVLTNSVLENVDAESNMLRRQLLKYRLQNTNKFKGDPGSNS